MRRWLARLVTRLLPAAVSPRLPAVLAPWTQLDRDTWGRILKSDTGRRMLNRARAVHYTMLRAASGDHFHAAQNAHAARGFEEAITWLESLANSAAAENGQLEAEPSMPPETDEQQAERELREMIARHSP